MSSVTIMHLLRSHAAWDDFDYSIAINWAIDQLRNGSEHENVLILASLIPSDGVFELRKYLSAALSELGMVEYNSDDAKSIQVQYHLECMLRMENVLEHLKVIKELCWKWGYREDLMPFYLLELAWEELEIFGTDLYYGTHKESFGRDLHKEATLWIQDNSILG